MKSTDFFMLVLFSCLLNSSKLLIYVELGNKKGRKPSIMSEKTKTT